MPWITDADEKQEVILRILRALPDWFGIPEAVDQYRRDGRDLPCYTARRDGKVVGFVSAKETSECALEMHVLGVLPEYHRRGAGRELVHACETYCKERGLPVLHVKTVDCKAQDAEYLKTYAFYRETGFLPLETLPLWDEANPCLVLVKFVDERSIV